MTGEDGLGGGPGSGQIRLTRPVSAVVRNHEVDHCGGVVLVCWLGLSGSAFGASLVRVTRGYRLPIRVS